jgi:hypothetical protein
MTDHATAMLERPHFSVGRVLEDSCETLIRTFPILLGITAIVAVPLLVWLVLGGEHILAEFTAAAQSKGGVHFDAIAAGLFLLIALTGLAINAGVTDAAFRHMLDEAADIVENLRRASIAAPSLIAASLFVAVLFTLALLMLSLAFGLLAFTSGVLAGIVAVPGFAALTILLVRWSVLVPVIVIEQANPIGCFGRSSKLTEDNRWRIFAVVLIVYVPEGIVKAMLLLASAMAGGVVFAVINVVVSGVFIAFNAVVAVTIYGHLRAIKEGSGTAALAEVFE